MKHRDHPQQALLLVVIALAVNHCSVHIKLLVVINHIFFSLVPLMRIMLRPTRMMCAVSDVFVRFSLWSEHRHSIKRNQD